MVKDKPFNGGTWTRARMVSFVMSALRRAQWPQKYAAVRRAYVKDGINPKTGRKCKLHSCKHCHDLFPQNKVHADHKEPVRVLYGRWGMTTQWLGINWNELMPRLWTESDKYDVLCHECHKKKSGEERKIRQDNKSIQYSK